MPQFYFLIMKCWPVQAAISLAWKRSPGHPQLPRRIGRKGPDPGASWEMKNRFKIASSKLKVLKEILWLDETFMAVCLVYASRPRDGASSENMVFEFCSENFLPPCFRSNKFEGGLHNWVFVRMPSNFTAFYKIRRHSQKYLSSVHSFGIGYSQHSGMRCDY